MSEEKQSPDNVSYAFMEKADLTERQSIRIAIERLAIHNPSIKEDYEDLIDKQDKSLEAIIKHRERNFEKEVQSVKKMLLDENDPCKNRKPVYKPKGWPGLGRVSLARAAEDDARCIVLADARREIQRLEQQFTESRRQYLSDVIKEQQRHTEKFNRSSGNERWLDRSQDQSLDREDDR